MLWWTDDLKTGIKIIDNQHKSIFDKATEIFQLDINSDNKKIEKALEFLMGYTSNHFYEEEQLMMKNNYPNFIQHREEHNYFVKELYKLYLDTRDNDISEESLDKLKVLVVEWLVNHINKSDKKFISTLKANN